MLPLFSNPLNISLPSPTRLPTFCFEWADLICTFAPSHGEKHLCATKYKQVRYLLILIFQFYAVFSYKKRTMGVDPKKSKTLSLPKATHKFRQSLRVYGRCSTVSQADVAAVFYKFRAILQTRDHLVHFTLLSVQSLQKKKRILSLLLTLRGL